MKSLPQKAKLLDIGCGNHSPRKTKLARPDIYYVGIDVEDYNTNETSKRMADKYIISNGEDFSKTIAELPDSFDAAISAHNIEHCNHPMETLDAICSRLKQGGKLYLSFPSEKSILFPSRKGTLNFYDDETHTYLPDFREIIKRLIKVNKMSIDYLAYSYRPFIARTIGMVQNIFNNTKASHFIWSYYGFETIIWAHKK